MASEQKPVMAHGLNGCRGKLWVTKLLAILETRVLLLCLMDASKKLTLAKIPIVLVCLVLLFVDFFSSDQPKTIAEIPDVVRYYVLLGLHLCVFVDLVWQNPAFSKGYYSVLTLCMAWALIPDLATMQATLWVKLGVFSGAFIIPLLPYLWITWLVWRQGKQQLSSGAVSCELEAPDSMP